MGARKQLERSSGTSNSVFILLMFLAGFVTYGFTWILCPIALIVIETEQHP